MKFVSSDGKIYLTHYRDCTRCCWNLIILNAPERWIKKKPNSYGLNRKLEIDKSIVENEINSFEIEFEIIDSCTHGQKKRKRPTKKKQKRTTQNTTPAVTLDNPENLSAYLQTEIGKQHYEFMQSELEKMDFDQLFM